MRYRVDIYGSGPVHAAVFVKARSIAEAQKKAIKAKTTCRWELDPAMIWINDIITVEEWREPLGETRPQAP